MVSGYVSDAGMCNATYVKALNINNLKIHLLHNLVKAGAAVSFFKDRRNGCF